MPGLAPRGAMDGLRALLEAVRWVRTKVATVTRSQLAQPTGYAGWDVRQLLAHLAEQNLGVAQLLEAPLADAVDDESETIGTDPIATDPIGAFQSSALVLEQALTEPGLPAEVDTLEVDIATAGAFVHELRYGWELAVATDQDATIPAHLAERALEIAPRVLTEPPGVGTDADDGREDQSAHARFVALHKRVRNSSEDVYADEATRFRSEYEGIGRSPEAVRKARARAVRDGRRPPRMFPPPERRQAPASTSHPHPRFFFLHLQKTGGTSFTFQLRSNFAEDEVYPDLTHDDAFRSYMHIDYLLALPAERVERTRCYLGHFPYFVTDVLGGDFVTLTVLRDPVERVLSLLRNEARYRPGRSLEEIYDDPAFVEQFARDHQARMFSMTATDRPESFLDVVEVDDARLATAKRNLERVDILGLHEHFGEFLTRVKRTLGWSIPVVPRQRLSERGTVSDALRSRIAEDSTADAELYEYARTLHDRQKG